MNLIAPSAYIGEGVTLGTGVRVGPGAVILGPVTVGDNAYIGAGAQLGAPPEISSLPQNAAWAGELAGAGVVIGAGAVIREAAVIHQGSHRATTVGAGSWILNRAYLAHDVEVGEAATVSAGVSIGGHCTIGDRVNIGMNAVVHQRRLIGSGAMVGMGTPVTADVPPFAKVYGVPPRLNGVNSVGIKRAGYAAELAELLLIGYTEGGLLTATELPGELAALEPAFASWFATAERKPVRLSQAQLKAH